MVRLRMVLESDWTLCGSCSDLSLGLEIADLYLDAHLTCMCGAGDGNEGLADSFVCKVLAL